MLTPDYLAHCAEYLLGLYDELDRSIIADIARRIVKTGELTPTAKHQITAAQNAGMMISEITKQVSQISGLSQKEVKRLFEEAAITGMQNDAKPLILNGRKVDIALSEPMRQTMQAAISKTNGDIRNLTLTTGVTAIGKYQDAVNAAYMKVQSGAFSYTEAIKQAIREAASDGNYVQYASGHRDLLDVAVRRSVLTGLNQTAGKLTEMYGKDMGCEYYETSAHAGARPSHSVWQGRVFKIEGEEPGYPNFVESTGYGTGEGLCGWNCRHSFYPFFPGLSVLAYTKEKLEWYDAPRYEYNGDKLTEYEVSQLMRKSEREIRNTKRELTGLNAAIDETKDESLKQELQNSYTDASIKLKKQRAKYSDICKQTNHRMDSTRTCVVSVKDEKGNVVSWNRSSAQKARWTAQKNGIDTKTEKSLFSGIGTNKTDIDFIKSDAYRSKFDNVSTDKVLNQSICKYCRSAVIHQSGDFYEDLTILRMDGTLVGQTSSKERYTTMYTEQLRQKIAEAEPYTLISIHNHGTNIPPTGADFGSAGSKKFAFGVAPCHDGKVYTYSTKNAKPFMTGIIDKKIDVYQKPPYNMDVLEAAKRALRDAEKNYGIEWREL